MGAAAVAKALGGPKLLKVEVQSDLDLASLAHEGISADAAFKAVSGGLLDADEFYALVIPRRTFERRRDAGERLTVAESDRLLRAVAVVVRATEALGDAAKARAWLRTPNRALRGLAPIALLETDLGARVVERTLGRIEHGVHS